MKPSSRLFIGTAIVIFILATAACLAFPGLLSSRKWVNLPVHSTMETLGGIAALLIALVLLQQNRQERNGIFFLVGTGFACMGMLDTFHAMCRPGDAFVFLHSTASLAGGFFFAWILLPDRILRRYAAEQWWIAGISLILCLSVGLRAVIFPQDVPKIIRLYEGKFTLAALLLNICASLLFLVSVPKFYARYRSSANADHLVFMVLALLFGLAELIFLFSDPWDDIWWAWHLLRLAAYAVTLFFVADRHFQLASEAYRQRQPLSPDERTGNPTPW